MVTFVDYSDDAEVIDALATLLEKVPEEAGKGLVVFRSRIIATEQNCLIVLATDAHDIVELVTRLGLGE